ncbi:MAG TPA: TIGR00725 family protein [Planctomycetota bacterium]|nr:TIGR00725 family protein [Planctomycetota bacterium]
MRRRCVSVIGASSADRRALAWAEEVGRRLAENDVVLLCGGLGGVMEAACRGAKSAGGLTVGILPMADRDGGNDYLDVAVATGMGYARNAIVAYSGDAVIAIGGSSGTLSEIAYATVRRVPVVTLGSWTLTERALSHGARPVEAASPADAVDKVLEILRR